MFDRFSHGFVDEFVVVAVDVGDDDGPVLGARAGAFAAQSCHSAQFLWTAQECLFFLLVLDSLGLRCIGLMSLFLRCLRCRGQSLESPQPQFPLFPIAQFSAERKVLSLEMLRIQEASWAGLLWWTMVFLHRNLQGSRQFATTPQVSQ
jgi:hypothetical protein